MSNRVKKIDFHTHIIPIDLPDFGLSYGGERWPSIQRVDQDNANMIINGSVFRKITSEAWDPIKRIERMDRNGIDMEVIAPIPVTMCYWAPIKGATEMARYHNDYIANVVKSYPDRFIGMGTVPLQDVETAILEMDRCVHKLGLKAIQIGSNVSGFSLDDPNNLPFFERAEQWEVPLFIHPYEMVGKDRTSKFNMGYTVGMPIEMALSVAGLINNGIMEEFPKLKICLSHGGGALPFILPRMDKGWETWKSVQKIPHPPSYYAKQLYYDALVYDPVNIQYLIDLVGHERLMMGTDYPFLIQETPPGKSVLETEGLIKEEQDAILGGNALKFLLND